MIYRTNKTNRTYIIGLTVFVFALLLLAFASPVSAQGLPTAGQPEGLEQAAAIPGQAGLVLTTTDPRIIVAKIIRVGLTLLGIVLVVLLLYAGFLWMTAAGNEEKIDKAKTLIRNAIIGLAIILAAFALTQFIISRLLRATGTGVDGEIPPGFGQCPPNCPTLRGALYVKKIQPPDNSPSPGLRNSVLKIILSRTPQVSTVTSETVKLTLRSADDSFVPVEGGMLSVQGTTIEYRPPVECPSPPMPEGRHDHCFDENSHYRVELVSGSAGIKGIGNQQLICRGLAGIRECNAEFDIGNVMDFTAPSVRIQWPKDTSVQVSQCIPVQARVTDDSGISQVVFFADGVRIDPDGDGGLWTPPGNAVFKDGIAEISCWPTDYPAPSAHTLTAQAFDLDDNQAVSSGALVMVRPAHCFDGTKNDDEDNVDCDNDANGPSGCALCDGRSCRTASDCVGGACVNGICTSKTVITGISPGDGRVGTFVTLAGNGFGTTAGTVTFTDNKIATAPEACLGATTWSDHYALVGVPTGATTGSLGLVRDGCAADDVLCRDATDDEQGPIVPRQNSATSGVSGGQAIPDGSFWVNDQAHPGLCALVSPPAGYAKGTWGTPIEVRGVQFGATRGQANLFFGNQRVTGLGTWSDTVVQAAVPSVGYAAHQVQLLDNAGVPSNALPYQVLSPDAATLPAIEQIRCASAPENDSARGGPGTVCTILGRNFGSTPGLIWFLTPDGRGVRADVSFPAECGDEWWTPTSISMKVPEVLDINDFNRNQDTHERLGGAYHVYVHRYDAQQSNRVNFAMGTVTSNAPGLACIIPIAGPKFTNVSLYGERFGGRPSIPNEGVHFTDTSSTVRTSGSPGWVFTPPASLTNVGGVRGARCPQGGWDTGSTATTICAQVPARAIFGTPSGSVVIRTTGDNGQVMSNPVSFLVGDCRLAAQDSGYIDCGQLGLTCCANGSCSSNCSTDDTPESSYGWQFSTRPQDLVPRVLEQCDTAEGEGHPLPALSPPSPSPSSASGRNKDTDVCVNAAVAVRFGEMVSTPTLNSSTVTIEKCTGAQELLSGVESTFDGVTALWARPPAPTQDPPAPSHASYLAVESSGMEGCHIDECNKEDIDAAGGALKLTKLNDDTGPGWPNANGVSQNYEHWFGYQVNANLDTLSKTYTASAWVRGALQSACGKRVGILIERQGGDFQKISTEKTLPLNCTTAWTQISTTIRFNGDGAGKPGFVRVFLEGLPHDIRVTPPPPEQSELFSVYVDQVHIVGDVCAQIQPLASGAGMLMPYPDGRGFRWTPQGGWTEDSWYRVVLRAGSSGIVAQTIGDRQGLPMELLPDATARCGHADAGYCFRFKTRPDRSPCAVGGIAVVPGTWNAQTENETIHYDADPLALGDPCIVLDPSAYSWAWDSSDVSKAAVQFSSGHIGRACADSVDCPIGSCVSGFCAAMPWTTTATALDETIFDAAGRPIPVKIQAYTPSTPPRVRGAGDLTIAFRPPEIIGYFPRCNEACTNAEIGVEFSTAIRSLATDLASVTNSSNIQLWAISCGNGTVDQGEDCDDGNTQAGDGCSASCLNEGSSFALRCGNARVDLFEDCDDNNLVNGDGCSDRCLSEGIGPGTWVRGTVSGNCGNGSREWSDPVMVGNGVGEQCDDGNTQDGDGCSARCLKEGTRSDLSVCGNGRLEQGEECERASDGTFNVWCDGVPPADPNGHGTCLRRGPAVSGQCGNGRIDAGEECDPASPLLNTPQKRALCTSSCQWTGTSKPTNANGQGCGNTAIEIGEDCDDGSTRPGDGCSANCTSEGSASSSAAVCGNNRIDSGETCDDGNTQDGDGCSSRCVNEGRPGADCANERLDVGEDCVSESEDERCSDICTNQGTRECSDVADQDCCGNDRKEPGEDCDGGLFCNADCLHAGRGAALVSNPTLSYNSVSNKLAIRPLALSPSTLYRVLVRGDSPGGSIEGVRRCLGTGCTSAGKQLGGLNFFHTWVDNPTLQDPPPLLFNPDTTTANSFSWTFKTKGEECAVHRVEVKPQEATLYVIGARQGYIAEPFGPPDSCEAAGQRLDAVRYRWSWATADTSIATVGNENVIPSCGNGIKETGEDCDDGNTRPGDGCATACVHEGGIAYACKGQGRTTDINQPQEECEPAVPEGDVFCTASCLHAGTAPCLAPGAQGPCCGNHVIEQGEDCDDQNTIPGDGCSPQCLNEGAASVNTCGNGTVNFGEECDPANSATGYFCNPATCLRLGTPPAAVCGNGTIETGEDCDDDNLDPNDGCSSGCQNEGSQAVGGSTCGNGIVQKGEDCDDGMQCSNGAQCNDIATCVGVGDGACKARSEDGCTGVDAQNQCVHVGTAPEVGPIAPATTPETPPRFDPYQQATARGIKKYCRPTNGPFPGTLTPSGGCTTNSQCAGGQICAPLNPWSTVDIQATAQQKIGSAPLTVYCGARTDKDCPTPEGHAGYTGTGNVDIGRGGDGCCYERPIVDQSTRTPSGTDACRNALIRARFTQPLDPSSLQGNVGIARAYDEDEGCPTGAREIFADGRVIEPVNLVQNGSFETVEDSAQNEQDADNVASWNLVKIPASFGVAGLSRRAPPSYVTAQDGDFVIQAHNVRGAAPTARYPDFGTEARQTVSLKASTAYRLSGWVFIEAGLGTPQTPVAVLGVSRDRPAGQARYYEFAGLPATTQFDQWVHLTKDFATAEAGEYTIFVGNYANRIGYFDNVELNVFSLAHSDTPSGFFARLWNRVIALLKKIIPGASAENEVWCFVNDLTVTPIEESVVANPGTVNERTVSSVTLTPSRVLDPSAAYRIVLIGDRSITDAEVSGIRSTFGVGFHPAQSGGVDQSWQFSTDEDICTLDEVQVTGGTSFTAKGETTDVHASAYHNGAGGLEPIQPIPGYSWTWSWGPRGIETGHPTADPDSDIVSVTSTMAAGAVADAQIATAGTRNGTVSVSARATMIQDSQRPDSIPQGACQPIADGTKRCANRPDAVCTTDQDCGAHVGRTEEGSTEFSVLLCQNPWPQDAVTGRLRIFVDDGSSSLITPSGAVPMYFSGWYCRDAGASGADDDLPALGFPPAVVLANASPLRVRGDQGELRVAHNPLQLPLTLRGREVGAGLFPELPTLYRAAVTGVPSESQRLKEFLFTTPDGKEAIGIRVMSNPARLSINAWYDRMGFGGKPTSVADGVDGYPAIKDGNTVYIGAVNVVAQRACSGDTTRTCISDAQCTPTSSGTCAIQEQLVYSNVYLVSLSEGAGAGTNQVFDQLIKNIRFNVNVGNQKLCAVDFCSNDITKQYPGQCPAAIAGETITGVQKGCSTDIECATTGAVACSADKDKLTRDLTRLTDVSDIARALEAFNARGSGYPTLDAGTFIRSMSNSKWPSWNATFGSALGSPLPTDPINMFTDGCTLQSGETGSYDQTTCWNERMQRYRCPSGSHIYQYRSLGTQDYNLGVDFERLFQPATVSAPTWNVSGVTLTGLHLTPYGTCAWSPTNSTSSAYSNAEQICGNGVLETGEICEIGQIHSVQRSTFPGNSCSLSPTTLCGLSAPCAATEGTCVPSNLCQAVRHCTNGCQWDHGPQTGIWGTTRADLTTCNGVPVCGNGTVETGEICDDGAQNGQYGRCKSDCTGRGPYCGNNVLNSPQEACDGNAGLHTCTLNSSVRCVRDVECPDGDTCNLSTSVTTCSGNNGEHGCCRFDCTGVGTQCGDGVVQEPEGEQCDGGVDRSPGRCRISGGTLTANACTTDSQCDTANGQTCALCPVTGTDFTVRAVGRGIPDPADSTGAATLSNFASNIVLDRFDVIIDGVNQGTVGGSGTAFTLTPGTHTIKIVYRQGILQGKYQIEWGGAVVPSGTPTAFTSPGGSVGCSTPSLCSRIGTGAQQYTRGFLYGPQFLSVFTWSFNPITGTCTIGRFYDSSLGGLGAPTSYSAAQCSTYPAAGSVTYTVEVQTPGYAAAYERSCTTGCGWNTWTSSCVAVGERCGDGTTNGTEQCDDGTEDDGQNDAAENADGCTNDCRRATCGDGFNKANVCTAGTPGMIGNACTTDTACGPAGVCQDPEECDAGGGNGTACIPSYGGTGCTYCDSQCNIVTRSGGFCGDRQRNGTEQCDGSNGLSLWKCIGVAGTTEAFERFEDIDGWAVTMPRTTRVELVHPGDASASAMRLSVYNTQNEPPLYNAHANMLPSIPAGNYIISARVKAGDARAIGKIVRIQKTNGMLVASAEIALTASWQTLEDTVSYSSGPAIIALALVQSEAQAGGAYGVDVDDVRIRPASTASCGSSGCSAQCSTGMVACENIILPGSATGDPQYDDDGDTIANRCDNDKDGDGESYVTDCNDDDSAIHHDASETCDDGVDRNCNGRGGTTLSGVADNECFTSSIVVSDGGTASGGDSFEVFLDGRSVGRAYDGVGGRSVSIARIAPGFHTVRVQTTAVWAGFFGPYGNFRFNLGGFPGSNLHANPVRGLIAGSTTGSTDWRLEGSVGSWMEITLEAGGQCSTSPCDGEYTCIEGWCYSPVYD